MLHTMNCSSCPPSSPGSPWSRRNPNINSVLPESGTGFRTYNREVEGADQVGLPETIDFFVRLGEDWAKEHTVPFQVGDISRRGGGPFPPHEGHRNGNEADLRPFRKDGEMAPTNVSDPSYDRSATRDFVKLVKRDAPDAVVLFNDSQLIREGLTKYYKGHHNHLHVRLPQLTDEPLYC